MIPYMVSAYGNPHSKTHFYGWEAEEAVEKARLQVEVLTNLIDMIVKIGYSCASEYISLSLSSFLFRWRN